MMLPIEMYFPATRRGHGSRRSDLPARVDRGLNSPLADIMPQKFIDRRRHSPCIVAHCRLGPDHADRLANFHEWRALVGLE